MLQAERNEILIDKYLQIKISNVGFNKIQEIELPSKIGRCPRNDEFTSQLALESPYVSREHVLIEPESALFRNKRVIKQITKYLVLIFVLKILITDLGSSNGTFLNGKRIPSNTRIAASLGDIIQLGTADSDVRGKMNIIRFEIFHFYKFILKRRPYCDSIFGP